jgi:hypothetical protein
MKIKRLFFLLSILFSIIACKPAAHIQVLQPAQIIVPEHINKILLVDRSKPSGGWLRNLESVFSGEALNQDQAGRRNAMDALSSALTKTPRFQTMSPGVELQGSRGGRSMMTPMSWYEVQDLCDKYNTDAIVAIEMFDSDITSSSLSRTVKEKSKDGKETTKIVYDGKKNGRVQLGWRFYDRKNKTIIDEYQDSNTDEKTSYGHATSQSAIDYIENSVTMVRNIAKTLGNKYGTRIAPTYVNVARTYFKKVKGSSADRFEEAARYADANEWRRSIAIWEKIADKNDKEAAAKALFNLAVAYEVNGQLNQALQFAKDAYTQYGLKNAKSYIRILENRIADQEVLQRQMHEQKKS